MMKMTLEELKNIVAEMESRNIAEIQLDIAMRTYYGITEVEYIDFCPITEMGYCNGTLFTVENN